MAQVTELPEDKLLLPKKEVKCDPVAKSSTEILTELFGVFNAKPPSITEGVLSDEDSKKRKKGKKKSKHKKKKKKKSKKKERSSSEASDSESEGEIVKKKSKKSKHKKRKRKRSKSDERSTTPLPVNKIAKKADSNENNGETPEKRRKISVDSDDVKIENDVSVPIIDKMSDIPIPKMPDISKIKLPEEDKPLEKSATDNSDKSKGGTNKIQIKNLKFSSVFEATVKQVEEEARKKAERFEEGQLTETSNSSSEVKVLSEVDSESDVHKQCDLRDKLNKMLANVKDDVTPREKRRSDKTKSSDKASRRSRSKSKTRTHKSRKRSRSRSRKSRSRSASHHKSRHRSRSNSRSRSNKHHHDGSRSNRRERRRSKDKESRIEIDKKRLLEIARKNAINMLQTGTLPTTANLGTQVTQNVITAIKCGGKSVDELTDFCKNLSRQEAIGELSSVSSNSDIDNEKNDSVSKTFNSPFQLKDRAPIVLNIKGGTALPTQSFQEKTLEQTKVLRQQFPVSSGSQHRGAETEWRPVSPPVPVVTTTTKSSHSTENTTSVPKVVAVVPEKPAFIAQTNGSTTDHLSIMPGMIQTPNTAVPPGPQVFPSTAEASVRVR